MIDALIGLFLVYAVLGLVNTALVEVLQQWLIGLKSRANILQTLIEGMLGKKTTFFDQAVIRGLSQSDRDKPSQLSAESFKLGLLGVLRGSSATSSFDTLADVEKAADTLDDPLKSTILALTARARFGVTDVQDQVKRFEALVDTWFSEALDRASGWFKRRTRIVGLVVAAVVCVGLDVDTLNILNRLSSSPDLRAKYRAMAENLDQRARGADGQLDLTLMANESKECGLERKNFLAGGKSLEATPEPLRSAVVRCNRQLVTEAHGLASGTLELGWTEERHKAILGSPKENPGALLKWFAGILISVFAISLGGESWFKTMESVIRLSGPRSRSAKSVVS